jgi:ABC-type antimicrobial peptide transport system permease subunit
LYIHWTIRVCHWRFVAAALVMAAIGAVAAWLPARRAAQVDPMIALRYE